MKIEINHIKKNYGKKTVLNDVTFSAESGECVGILGGNGSGKSTLLSILAGVQTCSSGEFLYDGMNLLTMHKVRSDIVGYVPQGTPLIEELTAKDNLLLWYDRKDLKRELSNGILATLGIDEFIKTPVSKMSGGMKKRLSIGCALAKRQPILLLDEPTAALDLVCKESITDYIRLYKNSGGIVILATHDVMEFDLCSKMFILKNGCLNHYEYTGDIRDLTERL